MIYNYVHFRSMPNKEAVIWLNNPDEIKAKIVQALQKEQVANTIQNAQLWFDKIVAQPADQASERIWNTIQNIVSKT